MIGNYCRRLSIISRCLLFTRPNIRVFMRLTSSQSTILSFGYSNYYSTSTQFWLYILATRTSRPTIYDTVRIIV
jgi:hypothetical protein